MDITFALSGGGARGIAHIGVMRVLEEEGFFIRGLAGTSMGGFIGAFYASDYSLDEIQSLLEIANAKGIIRARPNGPGIFGLGEVRVFLDQYIGDRGFNDLNIPFATTATDLETCGERVVMEGKVVDAVMATIALPGIFNPQLLEGKLVVDGGIVDPVPILPARSLYDGVILQLPVSHLLLLSDGRRSKRQVCWITSP